MNALKKSILSSSQPNVLALHDGHPTDLHLRRLEDEFSLVFSNLEEVTQAQCARASLIIYCPTSESELLSAISQLRAWSRRPIMILGHDLPLHLYVEALDRGANDFMEQGEVETALALEDLLHELRARLRVHLRPNAGTQDGPTGELVCGSLVLIPGERSVVYGGRQIQLTRRESMLLELLLRSVGEVVTHEELLTRLWGEHYATSRHYLRVYINRLRSKLTPQDPDVLIVTVRGEGYMIRQRR